MEVLVEIYNSVIGLLGEPWVILVLVASLMFAIGNYIDEILLCKYKQEVGTLVIISASFGLVLMAVFTATSYYFGDSLALSSNIMLQAIGVGVLEAVWVIPYLYATQRRGAMVAGPLFQVVPVIALGLEATLGILPTFMQAGGAALIVIGGILLSIKNNRNENGETNHRIDWLTMLLMMVSCFLIALIYVLFKDAVSDDASYLAVGFWSSFGMVITGIAIWLVVPNYRRNFNTFCRNADGKAFGLQYFNELMDSGGAYLTHLANVLGPSVMLVTAFNATQPIAIMIIGALFGLFGLKLVSTEKRGWLAWTMLILAIILIAVGTVIVAIAL